MAKSWQGQKQHMGRMEEKICVVLAMEKCTGYGRESSTILVLWIIAENQINNS